MVSGKYDALTIADYVVSYCYEHNIVCSVYKTMSLLYFIQAHFLVNTEEKKPCFVDPIIAVDFGVVITSVFLKYRTFGSGMIPCRCRRKYYLFSEISGKDMAEINEVVESLGRYRFVGLLETIYNQAPWKETYKKGYGRVIKNESIAKYFNEND